MNELNRFLDLLADKGSGFRWGGSLVKRTYTKNKQSITYLAFETVVEGFEIKVTSCDCNSETTPHGSPQWFELVVCDRFARFGRRNIVDREVFVPTNTRYEAIRKAFAVAKKKGVMLPKGDSRLKVRADVCLAKICRVLGS